MVKLSQDSNMTLDDFRFKWNGKGIDFDGAFGNQCMDLMHQYVVDCLGIADGRVLAASAAKDVYLNFNNIFGREYFSIIANTPTNVPQKGDIVFWGTAVGPYGHVAVCLSADIRSIVSFDQNWNGHKYCETVTHDDNYIGVLGWLRKKPSNPIPVPTNMTTLPTAELDGYKAKIVELDSANKRLTKELALSIVDCERKLQAQKEEIKKKINDLASSI